MDATIFFISFLQMTFAEIEVVILPELLEGNKLDTVSDGECEMLQITDTGKTVVNQVQPGLFWIGAVAVYSPWMDYLGCEKMLSTSKATTLSGSSQLYDCEKACDEHQYVGLQESKCFCFDGNANRGGSCAATPCGYNNELLCATDGSNYATMYYRSNAVQFHECAGSFSGNCLLYDNETLSKTVCYRSSTCKTNHSIVCTEHKQKMSEDNFYTDPLQTWKDALKYCVYNQKQSFLSSISDFSNKNKKSDVSQGQFWTSTVRGLKFYNMKDVNRKEEYFCVASRVIDRTVTDIQIIPCTDHKLPVACIIEMEEDVRDNIWLILVPSILLVLVIIAVIAVILCKPRCSSVRIIVALTRKYKTSSLIGEDALVAAYTTGGSSMNTEPRVEISSVYREVNDALPFPENEENASDMAGGSGYEVVKNAQILLPCPENEENASDMAGGSGYEVVKNAQILLPCPGNLTEIPLTDEYDNASSSTVQKISAGVVFKPSNINRTTGPIFKRNDYDTMADIKAEMEGVYDHAFHK